MSDTLIRPATTEDLPACAELIRSFYAEASIPGELIPEVFVKNWTQYLDMGIGEIYVAENGSLQGAIGGIVGPDPNDGARVAQEMFWYVCPEYRRVGLRLFNTWVEDLRCAGVKRLIMGYLEGSMPDKVRKFYDRIGLQRMQVSYVGNL